MKYCVWSRIVKTNFHFFQAKSCLSMFLDWILEGVLLGIIGVLGIVGNATAIHVFYKRSSGVAGKVHHLPLQTFFLFEFFYMQGVCSTV